MERNELVIAAMSPARDGVFSPVQVQKLFFLLDENISAQPKGHISDLNRTTTGRLTPKFIVCLSHLRNKAWSRSHHRTDGLQELIG